MSLIKSIEKAIYLLKTNISQPRVLGHMFLSFLLELIKSHKRICSAMSFS